MMNGQYGFIVFGAFVTFGAHIWVRQKSNETERNLQVLGEESISKFIIDAADAADATVDTVVADATDTVDADADIADATSVTVSVVNIMI